MKFFSLILRSLRHYWRWHAGLLLGVALTSMIVTGSLIVGDCVKGTLRRQAEVRLGRVTATLSAGDGFFSQSWMNRAAPDASPVLLLRATVSTQDSGRRANNVNLLGITDTFWKLGAGGPAPTGAVFNQDRQFAANAALSAELKARPGDTVIVRFEKPGLISRDAPLSGESDQTAVFTSSLADTIDDRNLGAFSLRAEQTPALNLFMPISRLQELAELPQKANLVLADVPTVQFDAWKKSLEAEWQLPELGYSMDSVAGGKSLRLSTGRIFLSDAMAKAAAAAQPPGAGVLTYLCNEARGPQDAYTAYPFVAALDPALGLLPQDLPADGIVVNQWAAENLNLHPGDKVTLSYFTVTRARRLEEGSAAFVVHSVLPMNHPAVSREWTPEFPGVMNSTSCADWKPGIPIKTKGYIRDADEAYWKEHKGTPKFFISLANGQELWRNRFGQLTSVRFPVPAGAQGASADVQSSLRQHLSLGDMGISFARPREMAEAAVNQSMDFGMLFLAMSIFLILTSLILAALLFLFNVESRAAQLGLLRAVGVGPEKARLVFLTESLVSAALGAALGVALAIFYTGFTLRRLDGDWSEAVAGLKFVRIVRPLTLLNGFCATLTMTILTVWLVSGRLVRATPRDLLAGESLNFRRKLQRPRRRRSLLFWLGVLLLLFAVGMPPATLRLPRQVQPALFFLAAFFLLCAGILLVNDWFRGLEARASARGVKNLPELGMRNAVRRRGRSLAIAGLLAGGIFLVAALQTFRQDAGGDSVPGTGGFALLADADLPVYDDLNSRAGREVFGISETDAEGVRVVPFRQRDGEEASCLNLNRAQTPQVLGVDPDKLRDSSFRLALAKNHRRHASDPWQVLLSENRAEDGAIPAVMDQASALWALGKNLGDTLEVADSSGAMRRLRLAGFLSGSVLQGKVIIAEKQFEALYPDTGGYRFFLMSAPAERAEKVRETWSRQLRNRGVAIQPTAARLEQFQAVQNTYLSIFSTLGGMGLLLSTVGLGLLIARNVLERQAEFGLMIASGFRRRDLRAVLLGEHLGLFIIAFILGIAAAALAVWPHVGEGRGSLPAGMLALLLTLLAAGGVFFCWLAATLALRKPLTDSLRHE